MKTGEPSRGSISLVPSDAQVLLDVEDDDGGLEELGNICSDDQWPGANQDQVVDKENWLMGSVPGCCDNQREPSQLPGLYGDLERMTLGSGQTTQESMCNQMNAIEHRHP